jgi:hypothetical protein
MVSYPNSLEIMAKRCGGDHMIICTIETWHTSGGKLGLTTNAKHLSEKAKTRRRRARFLGSYLDRVD